MPALPSCCQDRPVLFLSSPPLSPSPPPYPRHLCCQAYIDFEIGEGNREGARELYERLLQRTRHVKVGRTTAVAMLAALSD